MSVVNSQLVDVHVGVVIECGVDPVVEVAFLKLNLTDEVLFRFIGRFRDLLLKLVLTVIVAMDKTAEVELHLGFYLLALNGYLFLFFLLESLLLFLQLLEIFFFLFFTF